MSSNETTDVCIRPIKTNDMAALNRILDTVCRERRYLAWTKGPDMRAHRAYLERNMVRGWPQVVAVFASQVLGWCDIVPRSAEGFSHTASLGVGVHPHWRGRGIGTGLLRDALAWSDRLGIEKVELEVFGSNTVAIALYRRFGFNEEGRKCGSWKLDGQYDDVVLMARWTHGRRAGPADSSLQ